MTTLWDFLRLMGGMCLAALAVVVAVVGYCIIADAVRDRRENTDTERTIDE